MLLHFRGAVEKKTVLENLDLVLLAMDETVDKGCVEAAKYSTQFVCFTATVWLKHHRFEVAA